MNNPKCDVCQSDNTVFHHDLFLCKDCDDTLSTTLTSNYDYEFGVPPHILDMGRAIAHTSNLLTDSNNNGRICSFYRVEDYGIKVFRVWHIGKFAYDDQAKAARHGLAPKVGTNSYEEVFNNHLDRKVTFYVSELATVPSAIYSIPKMNMMMFALDRIGLRTNDMGCMNTGSIDDRIVCIDFS